MCTFPRAVEGPVNDNYSCLINSMTVVSPNLRSYACKAEEVAQ